jgi:hypothetical protein
MDPDEVIRLIEIEEPAWEVERIVEEISAVKQKEKDLRAKIPLSMHVSFF